MCSQLVTGLTSPARNRAIDAVDLVLIAERWTQFVWATGVGAFVVAVVATNRTVAAGVLVGVVVLVLVTRPAILMATRALPGLFTRIDELIDLETTRRSANPEPLARLLVHLLEDDRQVQTNWRVAQLWFERDAINRFPRFMATASATVGCASRRQGSAHRSSVPGPGRRRRAWPVEPAWPSTSRAATRNSGRGSIEPSTIDHGRPEPHSTPLARPTQETG